MSEQFRTQRGKTIELEELVQVDRRSWVRVPLVVIIFVLILVATMGLTQFLSPNAPRWVSENFFAPFVVMTSVFATIFVCSRVFDFLGLSARAAGLSVNLSEHEVRVCEPGQDWRAFKNRELRLVRRRRFRFEVETADRHRFWIPEFVDFRSPQEEEPVAEDGLLTLEVESGQVRLQVRTSEGG